MTGLLTFRVSTAQPRNRATAQPRNRATAQPRNSAGNSFAQTSLLPPLPDNPRQLPQFACRCPGFDNDRPEFWWGERPREPRCPESKTYRPDHVNACPEFDSSRADFQTGCPGLVSGCAGSFRLCPDFQTVAPFLKAFAPIYGAPRRFCNLLPQSNLHKIAAKRRKERKKPSPVLSDTLSHRMGEGRGEGCLFFSISKLPTPNF